MNKKTILNINFKVLLLTLLNAIVSGLISVFLTVAFLDINDKGTRYLTFIAGFWIYFNLQKLTMEEIKTDLEK